MSKNKKCMKVYSFCGKIFLSAVYGVTWVSCQDCCTNGAPNMKVLILYWSIESARYQKGTKEKQKKGVFKKKEVQS